MLFSPTQSLPATEAQTVRSARRRSRRGATAWEPGAMPAFCASVAHEVNQPLAAIIADASACRRWLAATKPNYQRLELIVDRILSNAEAAAEIIDGLRTLFAPGDKTSRVLASVNDLIHDACAQLGAGLKAQQVEVALQLDPVLPTVTLDRTLIRQLLINLMRNGAEAMETSPDQRRLELRSSYQRGEVRVEVCDEGTGVPDAARMFDTLFTTKPKGMGMGLAICRRIVETHGGRLWMEPGVPIGTRMIFTLPVRDPFVDRFGDA